MVAWCPEEYFPFSTLAEKIRKNWLTLILAPDFPIAPWDVDQDPITHLPLEQKLADHLPNALGPVLSAGRFRAAGIMSNGALVWIPPEAWRGEAWRGSWEYGDGRLVPHVTWALEGNRIEIPLHKGASVECAPVFTMYELCRFSGVNSLVEPPSLLPKALKEAPNPPWFQPAPPLSVQTGKPHAQEVSGLSWGVHALPSGYIAFDGIPRIARVWADKALIARDILPLLSPIDTDSMTEFLASGRLRTFGISRQTGKIIHLPPSTWRIHANGQPQAVWAIGGDDILAGPDGETCLPIISRADLARALDATEIPPDPEEFPDGWVSTELVEHKAGADGAPGQADVWMRGYAEGFKANGRVAKQEDAVKAACKSLGCTTRQAEAAFAVLPYPELRNPPRKAAVG